MNFLSNLRTLRENEDGNSLILFAAACPAMMGMAAMAVDLGSLYLAQRELQNLADAAVVSAVADGDAMEGESGARKLLNASGIPDVKMTLFQRGHYTRDVDIDWRDRFVPGHSKTDATRISLVREVPLFFGSLLTGGNTSQVVATATAARKDLAGFALDSRIFTLSGGLPNQLLSALLGTELNLDDEDLDTLVGATVDILEVAEILRDEADMDGATFGEVFGAELPLPTVVSAIGKASGGNTDMIMQNISFLAADEDVALSEIIDLGPLADSDINDGTAGLEIGVYSLLRSTLELSHGDGYDIALDVAVPGATSTKIRVASQRGEERSPWMTVSEASEIVLHTAQTRIYVESRLAPVSGLAGTLRLPLFAELGSAEAQITDIACGNAFNKGVFVDAKPALAQVAIADIDKASFDDFSASMRLSPAILLDTALVDVDGEAEIEMGSNRATSLFFSMEEIAARKRKSVGSTDLTDTAAQSLARDIDLRVKTLGLTVNAGTVTSIVGTQLQAVTPALDTVINNLTGLLGLRLGVADVVVDRVRCGHPSLVA